MLTYEDCLGMCDFSKEEIESIARQAHVPEIIAIELAEYLIHSENGPPRIRRIIFDDIVHARATGDTVRLEKLELVLKHFIATHPDRDTENGVEVGEKC
ncbi:MAG: hypothetical protein OEU36_00285 [Gammaproteobacteria bacterium]|nr:hypothetical protein [Gammaproteobacteria bacterium]